RTRQRKVARAWIKVRSAVEVACCYHVPGQIDRESESSGSQARAHLTHPQRLALIVQFEDKNVAGRSGRQVHEPRTRIEIDGSLEGPGHIDVACRIESHAFTLVRSRSANSATPDEIALAIQCPDKNVVATGDGDGGSPRTKVRLAGEQPGGVHDSPRC